jgi:hypothetical protein
MFVVAVPGLCVLTRLRLCNPLGYSVCVVTCCWYPGVACLCAAVPACCWCPPPSPQPQPTTLKMLLPRAALAALQTQVWVLARILWLTKSLRCCLLCHRMPADQALPICLLMLSIPSSCLPPTKHPICWLPPPPSLFQVVATASLCVTLPPWTTGTTLNTA